MRNDRKNIIVDMTFRFSLDIIEFADVLESKRKFRMASQLFGSGTSIGANVREAQNAESKSDFIHKMKIAAKEIDETIYWLALCKEAKSYPDPGKLVDDVEPIHRIISKIISTAKSK